MEFYILNQNEEITATLSTDALGENTPVYSATVDEKLGSYDVLELSIPSGVEHNLDIKEEYYIVFNDVKGFREYIITEVVDVDDGEINKTITAELSSIELLDEIIQSNLTGNNPTAILTNMLANTRWTIGNVDPSIYNSTFSEETGMVSVLEGINLLSSSFNAEVSFSYAVAGNKITKRFVNLHKQMGANNGKRFEVDKDVTSIKRTIDTSSIKTAIIPFGAESEGKARLNIKNIVWTKSAGNPVDKPFGQEWIGDPSALANWGKNNSDGSKRHKYIAQEINVETAAELANMAWVQLGKYTNPKTTYEAKAMDLYTLTGDEDLKHEYVNLGDTVVITDYYFAQPLVVQSRVSELKRDLLEPLNNDLVFGDSLELFSTSKQDDRLEIIKKELSNRIELVRQSADGKSDTYLGSIEPIIPNEKDIWYRPHPTLPNETQFLIFNGLTWDVILDTSNLDAIGKEVTEAIEQADTDRAQALANFETAKSVAKEYTDAKALAFDTELETVQTNLSTTIVKADKAIVDSETAIKDAGFAKVDASTAKENAVTAITTANTAQTNVGTALAASQTAISNSGTALTNAQTALNAYNNLEIGGRNLILNSQYIQLLPNDIGWGTSVLKMDEDTPYWHITGMNFISTYEWSIYSWMNANCIVGNSYTIGVDVRISSAGTVMFDRNMGETFITDADVWTRIFHTFDYVLNYFPSGLVYDDGAEMDYRNWKLESGNKGTDWSPAPEDVQVQIANINGELSRKVAQTAFDTLNGTVTGQSTLISQSQTAIALKADKTVIDTINSTVASHTLSIKATADSLATKAEKTLVDSINGTVAGHTSQIKVNADGLILKADSSLVNTVKGTVDTHTTQIKATSDGLALKAESSLVNTINGTVNTHTGQISANSTAINARLTSAQVDSLVAAKNYVTETVLNATSSSLNASITQVSTDLDNISTWERNYYVNTATPNRLVRNSGKILDDSCSYEVQAVVNPTGTINTAIAVFQSKGYGQGWELLKIKELGTNSNHPEFFIDAEGKPSIRLYGHTSMYTVQITHNEYKGRYTPLIDSDLKFTTLNATVDGIQTTVGTKANQTQVTQLAGQITTKVESSTYNSKMTQLDSAINLRVQSGEVTAAILADKTIKDTRNDNQLPDWYNANYPKQIVFEFKYRNILGVPGSSSYGQLETKVIWNHTAGGVITQIFSSSDGVFQRISNASYTAWNAWDKVAESGKLISQINISTEGILLQGKRIQLDGDVTMTTAFVDILNVKTLSAVTANIATIRTQILTADVITSTHLKSDTALITKIFANDANIGVLTSKTAFINSVKAVDISADRVTAGTLNAANVNIINLNVNNLVGNTTSFIQSNWNSLNTSLSVNASGLISQSGALSTILNAGSLTTVNGVKSGTVNALGMEINDSSNGWTTKLYSDGLEFKWYDVIRRITQTSEGLEIKPVTGSGARLNSALALTTGSGADKIAYLQLSNPTGGTNARLEMNGTQLSLRHPNGGSLDIADYQYNGLLGRINSGKFRTATSDGRGIEMAVSQISALSSNQTIYIMPSGTGELRIGNGSANPTLWPIRAASFVQGSSRDSKTNIEDYAGNAVNELSQLQVVTYNRKDELERGIYYQSIGFIAEDSPQISAYQTDGSPAGVDNYKMVSLAIRGVQELNLEIKELKQQLNEMRNLINE